MKACADPKSRPGFLTDKTLEPAIKYIVRKFPQMDIKVHIYCKNTVYSMLIISGKEWFYSGLWCLNCAC